MPGDRTVRRSRAGGIGARHEPHTKFWEEARLILRAHMVAHRLAVEELKARGAQLARARREEGVERGDQDRLPRDAARRRGAQRLVLGRLAEPPSPPPRTQRAVDRAAVVGAVEECEQPRRPQQ